MTDEVSDNSYLTKCQYLGSSYDGSVDPYRAPQPPPSPPRDAMRPVLIGAGVIAGLLAAAAIVLVVMEKRERDEANAPPPPKPPMSDRMKKAMQEQPPEDPPKPRAVVGHDDPAPPPIPPSARGIIVDGAVHGDRGPSFSSSPFDFQFAIFPANDKSASAGAILATKKGHGEANVPNGLYDLCWSKGYPHEPYPKSRADWSGGCVRVLVSPVVHVSANVGQAGPKSISFRCAPQGACPKS
jgi:hypothetical protein